MPNREYWRKCAEWMSKQLHRGENVPVGRIMRLYRNAFDAIDADIRKLEAAKAVSWAELEAITRDLNRIALSAPDMIRQNHVLKNILSYQYRIDRAQWVKARAYTHLMKAAGRAAELVKPTLAETYKAARYGTLDDIAMGLNCGVDFSLVPERTLNRILEAPFHGKNYVQSIWDNMEEAAGKAQKIITEGMVKGAGYPQMARSLAKITNNTYYNAYRLVQTEITHFTEQGRMDAYRELGIERYTYYAMLGAKLCDACAALDGKSFELDRAMEGENLPPIHPHCMCYTVVGDVRLTSRTARNPLTGENYKVRGDMTYQEWKESLTGEERMAIKAYRNRHSDSKQYERYKTQLGEKNTPKSFELFQKMKYYEPEKWTVLQEKYVRSKYSLQSQLAYIMPTGEKNFIPSGAEIYPVRTIAGAGSKTELRVEGRLIEIYGGNAGEWKKRVGKVESDKYIFDVHWYELYGKQYEMKLKSRSDK